MKRYYRWIVPILSFVFLLIISNIIIIREIMEGQYLTELSLYISVKNTGDKPPDLETFKKYLLDTKRNDKYSSEILSIHRQSKPVLTTYSSTDFYYKGKLSFKWLFGREYEVKVKRRVKNK